MILHSLTPVVTEYGYPIEFELKNDNFNGHQKGVYIGTINQRTKTIERSGIPDDMMYEKLKNMMQDKRILILEDNFMSDDNGTLVPKTMLSIPYYVVGHSAYEPTVNYEQISTSVNTINHMKLEILFVHEDGWYNRYVTINYDSNNMSMLEIMEDIETIIEDDCADVNHTLGFHIADSDGEYYEKDDIVLDFYDKAGNKYEIGYKNAECFKNLISSIRIIDINIEIVNKED